MAESQQSSDWPAAEPGAAPPESQVAPSSDFFDGEVFGDELLLDIYNAAVGEGASPEAHNEEIPALPPHPNTTVSGASSDAEKAVDSLHEGARVAETAAILDVGFQSATSYNDLTTLLTPSGKPAGNNNTSKNQMKPSSVAATVTATTTSTATSGSSVGFAAKVQAPAAATHAPGIQGTTHPPPGVAGSTAAKRKAETTLVSSKVKKPAAIAPAVHSPVAISASRAPAGGAVVPAGVPETKPSSVPMHRNNVPIQSLPAPPASAAPAQSVSSAPNPAPVSSNPAALLPKKPTKDKDSSLVANKKPTANHAIVPETAVSAPKEEPTKSATEADFKTVAQAAVSSLILSTKSGEAAPGKPETGSEGINTSTAHVKALTGSNWVAACSGTGTAAVAAGGSPAAMAADPKANRSKRQNLTADERARQNRDRNREHARNTRLRKKAYVEELKRTLTELVAQRDKAELEKCQSAQREVEQREVRFRVIEEFLKLRGRNETNYASWAAILDPNFSLTVPATDFRAMVNGGTTAGASEGPSVKLEKMFSGVHEAMNESNSFALFLQSLGGEAEATQYAPVGFVYNCDRNNFFMDDSHAVLDWSAGTVGITKRGSQSEVSMRGSVRASFCPASNKLLSASIMFDTGAVLSQLQEFMTIPSTPYEADAQAASHRADAILDSLQMPQLDKPMVVPQGESSDEGS